MLQLRQEKWQDLRSPVEQVAVLDSYLQPGPGMAAARSEEVAADQALEERERVQEMLQTRSRLREALADGEEDEIETTLKELRQKRKEVRNQLQTARQELRDKLSPRQEATLVLLGLLD